MSWDHSADPEPVRRWIARCARLLAHLRSEPTREADPIQPTAGYVPEKLEHPWRAHAVLTNIACGHALVHGRDQLTEDDLLLVARIAVSSMRNELGRVIAAAVAAGGEPLVVADIQRALGARHPETARKVMRDLDHREVMAFVENGDGRAARLELHADWSWLALPEFSRYLLGEPVMKRGVCMSPITNYLAESESGEMVEKEPDTHIPRGVTAA